MTHRIDRRDPELRLDRRPAGQARSRHRRRRGLAADAGPHDARGPRTGDLWVASLSGTVIKFRPGLARAGAGRRPGTVLARRSMATAEFDLPAGHLDAADRAANRVPGRPASPRTRSSPRSSAGSARTAIAPDRNFAITYSGTPHADQPAHRGTGRRARSSSSGPTRSETGTLGLRARGRPDDGLAPGRARSRRRDHDRRHRIEHRVRSGSCATAAGAPRRRSSRR